MTAPLADATVYQARIDGSLDADGIYPLNDINTYRDAQQGATAAIGRLLGTEPVDFHIIARTDPGEPLYRARWRLHAEYGGPYFRPFSNEHDTTVDLRLWVRPLGEYHQLSLPTSDQHRPEMPYRTTLSGLYSALILRHAFGTIPRQITIPDHGTVTVTPQTLTYRSLHEVRQVTAPMNALPAEYEFLQPDDGGPGKALWLAITGAPSGTGWKVSYCTPNPGTPETRWDDPEEPVPEYEPVPFTAPA